MSATIVLQATRTFTSTDSAQPLDQAIDISMWRAGPLQVMVFRGTGDVASNPTIQIAQAATLTHECFQDVSGSSRSIENDGPADPIVIADGLRYLRWVVSGITGSDKAVISITGVGR